MLKHTNSMRVNVPEHKLSFRRISGLRRVLLCLLTILAAGTAAEAQECMQTLRTIFTKLNALPAADARTSYYIDFTFETVFRDKERAAQSSRSQILMFGDKVRITSPNLESYQDRYTGVVVDHQRRSVLLRRMPKLGADEAQELLLAQMQTVQESVLQDCELDSCSTRDANGIQTVRMQVKPSLRSKYPFITVEFELDTKAMSFRSVRMIYADGNPIHTVRVVYHTIDYAYPTPADIGKSAESYVLRGSELAGRYAGYTLVDMRENAGGQ